MTQDEDFQPSDEDAAESPLQLLVEAQFADGARVVSRSFLLKADWERMDSKARQDEIQDGLQGMSDAVMAQILKRDLTV